MLARLTGATSRAAGFVHGVAAILLLPYAGALAATPKAALAAVVLAAIGPGVARPKGVLVLRGSEAGARRGADNVGGGGRPSLAADCHRTQVAWLTALASVVADPTTGFLAGLAASAFFSSFGKQSSKKAA